jgi:phosphatidylglycerophosphate synthase
MSEPSQPLDSRALSEKLRDWSRIHAALLVLATALSARLGTPLPLACLGFLSFVGLFWLARGRFTSSSGFGPANALTLLRLALVIGLAGVLGPVSLAQCALMAGVVLLLDGVDGWVARKTRSASAFGAQFDMETDAFFVLMTSLVLWLSGRLGYWILCGGLLRPLYVLWLWALPAPDSEEPRSNLGRLAFLCFAGGLVVALASSSSGADALAVLGTVAVTLSFGRSARYWYRARVRK